MHGAHFILADNSPEGMVKLVFIGIAGAIWLLGQFAKTKNAQAKKNNNRPPRAVPPASSLGTPQPPIAVVGRPGGPATAMLNLQRLTQARAAQARAALLAAGRRPPVVQQRPPVPIAVPAPPRPATTAPAAAPPKLRPAVTVAALSPHAAAAIASVSPRSGQLPRLTPQSLRSQYILTEILRPPVALRESAER